MEKVFLIVAMLLVCINSYAREIVLDGDFSDWVDKPSITSEPEKKQPVGEKAHNTEQTNDAKDVVNFNEANNVNDANEANNVNETNDANEANNVKSDNNANDTDNSIDVIETEEAAIIDESKESETKVEEENVSATVDQQFNFNMDDDKESNQNSKGPKFKISQLSWSMSEDSDVLFIMVRLSHDAYAESTEVATEMITDYGSYDIRTNYDTSDGTVFTVINGTNFTSNEGKCTIVNKNTVYLEYAIPLSDLIHDMKWGYMIKIKVSTEDDVEPKKDYIIIATASSGPIMGAVVGGIIAGSGLYFSKRKRKKKQCCY